ncbi:MAG TPA: 50S ribosomal protein L7Ae [archaeon]|nr:50S ribosomal protein L7Ae [archaeon]
MAKEFVKFPVSKELASKTYSTLELVSKDGKFRIGTNEATKAIEGSAALLVVIAEDVEPPEIVMHLPLLCREKKIPFTYVPSKKDLGKAAGIEVSTAAVAVLKEGASKKEFRQLLDLVGEASKNTA